MVNSKFDRDYTLLYAAVEQVAHKGGVFQFDLHNRLASVIVNYAIQRRERRCKALQEEIDRLKSACCEHSLQA